MGDLGLALKLPGAALIATTVKPAHWERAAGMADGVASRLGNSGGRADERTIERYLGASAGVPSARSIRKGLQRNQRLNQLHYVASWCPGGWSPTIDLVGAEHLHAALAGGRGAVLWVAPLVFAPLVAKRALHEGGFSVHHLSRPNHGFSSTRFGVAVLNPVRTRVEDRYLAERITISKANETTAAVRALADRLATNRIISITMTSLGMRQADVPFLDGRVRVAPGAARLAQRSGAPLLPVFALRTSSERFVVEIRPPLSDTAAGDRDTHFVHMARAYADQLATVVRRHPDQFLWNGDVLYREPPAATRTSATGGRQ